MKQTSLDHNRLVQQSIVALPQQLTDGLAQWTDLKLKSPSPKQLVVCGMGGSALAADILRYALWNRLSLPITIVNNYQLPAYVSAQSLIIVVSYSGDTEEPIACLQQALKKGLPVAVMTSGGTLATLARAQDVPLWQFQPSYNISGQPRYGLGYLLAGMISLVSQVSQQPQLKKELKAVANKLQPRLSAVTTAARQLGSRPTLIIASEHLLGSAHTCANQLNESAKVFAVSFALPELNHHLLESLASLPRSQWSALFWQSDLYNARTQKRYRLTQSIMKKAGLHIVQKKFIGSSLEQAISAIAWSSALSLQLSLNSGGDASLIPLVDQLKRSLA